MGDPEPPVLPLAADSPQWIRLSGPEDETEAVDADGTLSEFIVVSTDFDGDWISTTFPEDEGCVRIKDNSLSNGATFTVIGSHQRCCTMVSDTTHSGELSEDGLSIAWNDGDIWLRKLPQSVEAPSIQLHNTNGHVLELATGSEKPLEGNVYNLALPTRHSCIQSAKRERPQLVLDEEALDASNSYVGELVSFRTPNSKQPSNSQLDSLDVELAAMGSHSVPKANAALTETFGEGHSFVSRDGTTAKQFGGSAAKQYTAQALACAVANAAPARVTVSGHHHLPIISRVKERPCIQCRKSVTDTVSLPCRHSVLCQECMQALLKTRHARCPLCRVRIDYWFEGEFEHDCVDVAPIIMAMMLQRLNNLILCVCRCFYAQLPKTVALGVVLSTSAAVLAFLDGSEDLIWQLIAAAAIVGYIPWLIVNVAVFDSQKAAPRVQVKLPSPRHEVRSSGLAGADRCLNNLFRFYTLSRTDLVRPCSLLAKLILLVVTGPVVAIFFFVPYLVFMLLWRPLMMVLSFAMEFALRIVVHLLCCLYTPSACVIRIFLGCLVSFLRCGRRTRVSSPSKEDGRQRLSEQEA